MANVFGIPVQRTPLDIAEDIAVDLLPGLGAAPAVDDVILIHDTSESARDSVTVAELSTAVATSVGLGSISDNRILRGNGTDALQNSALSISDLGVITSTEATLEIDAPVTITAGRAFVADSVDINGGAADSLILGGSVPAAATVTTLIATGGGSLTGTWSDLGTVSTVDINGGSIDGTIIGASSADAATVTTLTASGLITANGGITLGTSDNLILAGGSISDSNGTVTVEDNLNVAEYLSRNVDNSLLRIYGGTIGSPGAALLFTGPSKSGDPDHAYIRADTIKLQTVSAVSVVDINSSGLTMATGKGIVLAGGPISDSVGPVKVNDRMVVNPSILSGSEGAWTTVNDRLIMLGADARFAIAGDSSGTFGCGMKMAEINTSTGAITNTWGIIRRTSSSTSGLSFRFGTSSDIASNDEVLELTSSGLAMASGKSISTDTKMTLAAAVPGSFADLAAVQTYLASIFN